MMHDAVASGDSSTNNSSAAAAVNAEAVLLFVCQLTQTVLKKSEHSLVVIDDKKERLEKLNDQLWTFDPVSFVPHNLVLQEPIQTSQLSAPVTLCPSLPTGFDGVVLNLAAAPLPLKNTTNLPERVLEIITPDELSTQQGRDKYRAYRDLGFELKHFPIK